MSTTTASTARKRRIITGLDLAGWDAIAGALDVSIRTAQKHARKAQDPLPVKRFGGRARASTEALQAWAERNTRPVGRGSAVEPA